MKDFFTADPIWAIEPTALERMFPAAKDAGIEPSARVQIADDSDYEPFLKVIGGVAVVPVMGTIVPRVRYSWSYLMSLARLQADISAAIDDPRVCGIVLDIDSPGGSVTGISEMAHWIREQSETAKPIVAFGAGGITSGAAWLGAACERKIVSTTSRAGSIGVMAVHADYSKMDERIGIKYTYLTAGKYKAIGNADEPLSDDVRQILEGQLGQIYDVFISDIALFRGASEEAVRSDMADGRIFIGAQAVEVGLADQTGNLEDAIEAAKILALRRGNQTQSTRSYNMNWKLSDIKSTDDLKAALPELASSLEASAREAGKAEGTAAVDTAAVRTEGATAESTRIMGLVKAHFGDEAHDKFAKVVEQGFSAEQYTSLLDAIGAKAPGAQAPQAQAGGQNADDAFKTQMLAGINGASAGDPGAGDGNGQGPQDWEAAVSTIMAEEKCTRGQAIKKAYAQYPDLHQAYIKAVNTKKTA